MKTASEVIQDFYDALKNSILFTDIKKVNGNLYKDGLRPINSNKEDVIIRLTTLQAEQIQEGIITILVYYNNIVNKSSFSKQNNKRGKELENLTLQLCQNIWVDLKDYDDVFLQNGIVSLEDEEVNQFFVSAKIHFSLI